MTHKLIVFLSLSAVLYGCTSSRIQNTQAFKGYPSPDGNIDIRANFANPPAGYGNVPFYWWTGDSLKLDRLKDQLDFLSDAPTDGFAVSYNHTHAGVDTAANAGGHGPCGVADDGSPVAFSEQWWKIWNEFSGMCADRGMGTGLDDYVFAWPGNHNFMDDVYHSDGMDAYQGRLVCGTFAKGAELPGTVLTSEPKGDDSLNVIFTEPSPELHPEIGKRLIERYFQPFYDRMDEKGRSGMNYFFQDEFMYSPEIHSWSEDMIEQFKTRKGYDIVPHLPALFEDRGEESIRTRLDYAEVVADLAEERMFKPVYEWHASRGLIYGCDNNGRGLEPTQYMDYFRQMSWFTAPGNDAPARGSSFTQTKVSSSIAHLYQRPRTWLEAFHSMGWDANGALLTHQLDHHIIAGGNLLCMHGLYYSTHGGWWEWAPPSFHFRMPYWPHMKKWLRYAERLCFVLSQGRHVCDVAILYPTETMQAIPGTDFEFCKAVSNALSEAGIDFDFIDYSSLQKASTENGILSVAGENYKILVLADIKAMHEETAEAVRRFEAGGGIVYRTDRDVSAAPEFVTGSIVRDFIPKSGKGRVLHRRIAENDVYMIMDIAKGDSIFFRSRGKVERWDAMNGNITGITALKEDDNGTWICFNGEEGSSQLIVFSPGQAVPASDEQISLNSPLKFKPLDGEWNVEVIPTMNNKWGDFRLPATDEFIGVEARSMKCTHITGSGRDDFGESVYGYAPYMLTSNGNDLLWKPYQWSWQYGVYDSPGSQGYHGLKGKVDCRFLILDQGCDQYFKTSVFAPSEGSYTVLKEGVAPSVIKIDGKEITAESVSLTEGWHELYLKYSDTPKAEYDLAKLVCYTIDPRQRAMVMLLPEGAPAPADVDMYDTIVASRWYGSECLKFNPYPTGSWEYTFETAPGTYSMNTRVNGTVTRILIDGQDIPFKQNGREVTVSISNINPRISTVTLLAEPDSFNPGAAFFSEPVKIQCRNGVMPAGDWTGQGAMRYFSGGVRYSREFKITGTSGKWTLDLGSVDATCEVWINGRKIDELLSIPYSVDITKFIQNGTNKLDILVYSSLSNHYQTIPSAYRGTPHAGLIGPVQLICQ